MNDDPEWTRMHAALEGCLFFIAGLLVALGLVTAVAVLWAVLNNIV